MCNPLRADRVYIAYITLVYDVSYKRIGLEARGISIALARRSVDPTGMGSNLSHLIVERYAF